MPRTASAKPRRVALPKPAAAPPAAALRKQQFAAGPGGMPEARPSRAASRAKVTPDRLAQLVAAARGSLEDDKAENIVVLDVTGRASFADCLIIATGLVDRQLQAMATHVQEALEKAGLRLRRDKIQASPDWVLLDADNLVVHLFKPEARATYALERMWGPDSPKGEGAAEPARAEPAQAEPLPEGPALEEPAGEAWPGEGPGYEEPIGEEPTEEP
jgi:ribosome-associated protein